VQACLYDPWQGIGLSQRLTRAGVKMVEWPQTIQNLSLMAGNLLELIKRKQIVCYESDDLRQAIAKTVAVEGSRGWRLGKAKQSDRVDPVIALAMAALATVQAGRPGPCEFISLKECGAPVRGDIRGRRERESAREDAAADRARAGRFARWGRFAGI